jgi:methylase of polypeptide subunit release factors
MLTEVKESVEGSATNESSWFSSDARAPLLELLGSLERQSYRFVTATPGTHARVIRRSDRQKARALRDVLGWSLPFEPDVVPADLLNLLQAAKAVIEQPDGTLKSLLRVSQVEGTLFLHSAYPTTAEDSVFLGPDSCRFAQWITSRMQKGVGTVLDYGAGAGVGGIVAARAAGNAHLTLADVNPKALFLASINAEHARLAHTTVHVSAPREVEGQFDLMVTHPPFMIDADRRAYRDGGDLYGAQLSLEWVLQGVDRLAPGGRLILHTGVSIVDGRDLLLEALQEQLPQTGLQMEYRELDPDIFSEDLDEPQYAQVERIAAVGLVLTRT